LYASTDWRHAQTNGLARLHHGPVTAYAGYALLALLIMRRISRILL